MTEHKPKIPALNIDVGCNILKHLYGIDASNFLEVVNNCEQFLSIATTSPYMFMTIWKKYQGQPRVLLAPAVYGNYLQHCEVVDDRLVPFDNHCNSSVIQPVQRLFVYSCFSLEGFNTLCRAYRTALFQCYSRLIPFNTDLYCADFGLIDYELYCETISAIRELNQYEKVLFKTSTYFAKCEGDVNPTLNPYVNNINYFRHNLSVRFFSAQWLEAIDFKRFIMIGSCVLNALCHTPFLDTKEQDVNFICSTLNGADFELAIASVIAKLQAIIPAHWKSKMFIEKVPGSLNYLIALPCGVKLKFFHTPAANSKNPLSHILHTFDMDLCQVAFIGDRIMCTFAFLQALATKSFIVYSLHAGSPKEVCVRIAKYCARGFTLLEPNSFDGNFDEMMKQMDVPLYRVERRDFIDENGELCSGIAEYWRSPQHNIDTFQVQEAFMAAIC